MTVSLNGTDQGINLGTPAGLDVRNTPIAHYTEFRTSATKIQFIFSHGRGSGRNEYRQVFINAQFQAYATNGSGSPQSLDVGSGLNDGNWHRALWCMDSGSNGATLRLFIDGSQVASGSFDGTNIDNLNDISAIGYEPDGNQFFFDGDIGPCAAWAAAFSTSDAEDLTSGVIAPDDLLTGILEYWPLDYDARGEINGIDGTPVGSPTFSESPPGGDVVDIDADFIATATITADAIVVGVPTVQADFVATATITADAVVIRDREIDADVNVIASITSEAEVDRPIFVVATITADAVVIKPVSLDGQLPALTGTYTAQVGDDITAQMVGELPTLAGSFTADVDQSVEADLTGALPALVGIYTIDATVTAGLAGTLPPLEGTYNVQVGQTIAATLTGLLPTLTGAYTADIDATVRADLTAILPALQGAFTVDIDQDVDVTLSGALPALTGAYLVRSGLQVIGRPIQSTAAPRPTRPMAQGRPTQPVFDGGSTIPPPP